MAKGDEALVVKAFTSFLASEGWTVRTEIEWVDILAERNGVRLYCEAKGQTSDPGLDIDTAFGQLLRRMPAVNDSAARFALVIRDEPRSVAAAERVPARIREVLRIAIYAVANDGTARMICGEGLGATEGASKFTGWSRVTSGVPSIATTPVPRRIGAGDGRRGGVHPGTTVNDMRKRRNE